MVLYGWVGLWTGFVDCLTSVNEFEFSFFVADFFEDYNCYNWSVLSLLLYSFQRLVSSHLPLTD